MAKLPKKFTDRVRARLKHFQGIAVAQRARDVSEADTVTLVKDILAEVFGYDKYSELTSEHQIRGRSATSPCRLTGQSASLLK